MLLPYLNKELIEAGCDEAGRGCLAGAVYAAAVILPTDYVNERLNEETDRTSTLCPARRNRARCFGMGSRSGAAGRDR